MDITVGVDVHKAEVVGGDQEEAREAISGGEGDVCAAMRQRDVLRGDDVVGLAVHDVDAVFSGGRGGFEKEFDRIAGVADGTGWGDAEEFVVRERKGFEVLACATVESFGFEGDENAVSILRETGEKRNFDSGDAVFVGVGSGLGNDSGGIGGSGFILRVTGIKLHGDVGGCGNAVGGV